MSLKEKRILSGRCPRCRSRLFFPTSGSVECTECGQRHQQQNLLQVEEVTDPEVVLQGLLRNALLGVTAGSKAEQPQQVKVHGLSNYHCKLLSPVLTRYGMDKQSGKARPLRDMNQGEMFDCSLLGGRSFLLEPEHVATVGYGRDRSGSAAYLRDTLEEVKAANGGRDCLIPLHVDGDGHCLVHAVSRALVGRELFWHALRENLKLEFERNLERYRALFRDFIDAAEWEDIVGECDPLFVPPVGVPLGLRNIHIFGLANVLHRPIVLLDALSGMRSSGDYAATFLPGLVAEERCRGDDGRPNPPICIAWSSSSRNHYIPLVGVREAELPKLPSHLLPKAWGVPQELIGRYVRPEADGGVLLGGGRSLRDGYLLRLVRAMEEVFAERHGVHPALVADVHADVYRRSVAMGAEETTEAARRLAEERRLGRCLACGALSEISGEGDERYDEEPPSCARCGGGAVRRVRADGTVEYADGDRTSSRSRGGKCGCGFKHFWRGQEYDNLPRPLAVTMEWGGRVVRETVHWFQEEAEPRLNSNAYAVAAALVAKHFPGEFGSELLVQRTVADILRQTGAAETPAVAEPVKAPPPPDKIILIGPKAKSIHKEELSASKAERGVQRSVAERAPIAQKRRTDRVPPPPSPRETASAPPTPAKSSSEKKLRVTTSDGRQATLPLPDTFAQLQRSLERQFAVPPGHQCIRHGFPPRTLAPPPSGKEEEPTPLRHGDRVALEILGEPDDDGDGAAAASGGDEETTASGVDLEMSSLCLLATLMGEDVWSYAKKLPHLFQQGGVFYNIVKKDAGLTDGKHFTLPHLAGKTFAFNADARRLELCADAAGHFPVGPDVDELASAAGREGSPAHGAVRRKDHHHAAAFQGRGHSLGGSAPSEPVRVGPGFVTTRDARGPDPALMEQQRRKLQEMVSSIQAAVARQPPADKQEEPMDQS